MAKRPSPQPLFGVTKDFAKAFPGIKDFKVTIADDPLRRFTKGEGQRISTYTRASAFQRVRCSNPRCQQGGPPDLQQLVMMFGAGGPRTFYCRGHEGSPAGRRKGNPCENVFTITVEIEPE